MASGYAAYLIKDMMEATGPDAKPNWKVDARGLLKMLYEGAGAKPIRNTTDTGEKREIRTWYRERNTKAQVDSSYSCDNVLTPARKEVTLTAGSTAQIAWHLPYDLLKNYEKEATSNASFNGKGATNELLDIIASGANAISESVNETLHTLVTFGKNKVTGAATAQTINFPQASTTQILNNGMAKVMSDYKNNGLTGTPNFVMGPGLPFQYANYNKFVSAASQNGFDNRIATAWGNWYLDQDYTSDGFIAFEPGSIQVVEYLENLFKPGKLGNSEFFTGTLPMGTDPNGNVVACPFDFQIKEIDCPTTLTDAYTGGTATYTRGHSLIMWKNFGLFQIPSDAYRAEDANFQVNGCLRFTATNS